MIRHTNIPDVHPGEPITAGLANQIIAGANTARVVTGDDSIDVTTIGNALAFSVNQPGTKDRGVLVEITSTAGLDDGEHALPGAIYQGRIYLQVAAAVVRDPPAAAGVRVTTARIPPAPNLRTCWVVNTAEFDQNTHLIPFTCQAPGRIIGVFRGRPLVAVHVPAPTVIVKITAAASGGGKYLGRLVTGATTTAAFSTLEAGNLAMAEGMTVASSDDILFHNLAENGSSGHALAIDGTCFVVGKVVGNTLAGDVFTVQAYVGGSGGGTVPLGTLFAVDLSNPSAASDGDATTACGITYDVADKLGNALLTGASPECPRNIGLRFAATKGTAYYDADNNPVLFEAKELESVSVPGCGEP